MTREIDRSPARLSAALATTTAAVSAAASGLASLPALAIGAIGVLGVLVGVIRGVRRAVTLGAAGLLVAALLGGLTTPAWLLLLPGVMAAVLAWDLGEQAINVGEQLGRAADTTRLETTHAAASTVVAAGGAALGYGIFLVGSGGQAVTALVFLLLAAVVLTSALGN
ncbi:hypothetical protein BRC82_01860 [Halobacteriales archaeon QS_1_67_19]|nr:MAG: hypothetical protein BRC82_01860 [Halobacteriales archaeon QS_1_67_19]